MSEKDSQISPNFWWLCACFIFFIIGLSMGMKTSPKKDPVDCGPNKIRQQEVIK